VAPGKGAGLDGASDAREARREDQLSQKVGAEAKSQTSEPQAQLDRRFLFTLDPCASSENAKCALYFTKELDGLKQDWGTHRVFCNPPYGREISKCARKCFEASRNGALVVMLVPARTCTKWFHDWVRGKAEIEFIRGRVRFGGADAGAPFPSMLCIDQPLCAHCGNKLQGRA
jgi:phage N-6-adenine-methyltransferase